MELDYVEIYFGFRLDRELSDPYLLFSCRTRFDAAFRHALGCLRGDCTGCAKQARCPYPAQLGQEISSDPEKVKRHQKPPLPFAFRFPLIPPAPNRGAGLECSLALFGAARQQLPLYLAAVRRLLEGVGASLVRIEARSQGGGRTPLPPGECRDRQVALPVLNPFEAERGPLAADRIALAFDTPVKLVQQGRPLKEIEFSQLARGLMRRVSAVVSYHGGAELPLDYRWLAEQSGAIRTVSADWSYRQWGGKLSGMVGSVRFEGELEPFHLLLTLGEVTGLGKGAGFGLGRFRLI